jgi:hypothetical protein
VHPLLAALLVARVLKQNTDAALRIDTFGSCVKRGGSERGCSVEVVTVDDEVA